MKILFVSISAPPKTAPESIQVEKVLKELLRREVEITLLTEKTNYKSWSTQIKSNWQDHPFLVERRIAVNNRILNKLLSLGPFRKIPYPDSSFIFHKRISSTVNSQNDKFDAIYSRSFPLSSTIAAYKLKEKLGIPWILHLSDPWTLNPLRKEDPRDAEWEAKCIHAADLINFTTPEAAEAYKKLFPSAAHKIRVFRNVIQKEEIQQDPAEPRGFLIRHTGNMYGSRTPKYFLEGFRRFLEELEPLQRAEVKAEFIGQIDHTIQPEFDSFPFPDNIELPGPKSFEDALKLQQEATILLSIDVLTPEKSLFLPSKLQDYMAARRPVLALHGEGSPTKAFVENKFGITAGFKDVQGIYQGLKELHGQPFELAEPDKEYFAETNVTKLLGWVNELTSDK